MLSRYRLQPPVWLSTLHRTYVQARSVLTWPKRFTLFILTLDPGTVSQAARRTARSLCSLPTQLPQVGDRFWLAGVLALAGFLRVLGIGTHSLWFDESFSWLVARQPGWAILTQRLEPILPPLYHFLLHFWLRLGESEASLRSFSVLCSLLTVPLMYALGRELLTPATGLAAALLTATMPFQVYFAQEARLYALVILLSTVMLWGFVRSWNSAGYWPWIGWGVLVALNIYAHYFAIFTLLAFHAFALLVQSRAGRGWRGLLVADLVALALVGPHLPSAWAGTRQVTSHFWLSSPSPLAPFKTLDYLLFGHTTPLPLVPVALFLTLSVFTLVVWTAARSRGRTRRWLLLLVSLVLVPILSGLLISSVVAPVYLDRSFSLVTPAYVLLLGWGLAHPPQHSPLRLLYAGLSVVVVISLGNHYLNLDPAKPQFREVGAILQDGWQDGDVLFHLHDSSYLPLTYYAPQTENYLLNNAPDAWLPPYTWKWAGQRAPSLDEAVAGASRLWLVVIPRRIDDQQANVLAQAEASYEKIEEWTWPAVDCVKLQLYNLGNPGQP